MSKKIYPTTLPSTHVGCSSAFNHEHLRIFPSSKEDKMNVKKLKWDPYLPMFYIKWDKHGIRQNDVLKAKGDEMTRSIKIKLRVKGFNDPCRSQTIH